MRPTVLRKVLETLAACESVGQAPKPELDPNMFKADKGGVRPPAQSSKPQNTAVGSGSRPAGGKIAIETSAPSDPHTLGRSVPGWMK